VKSGNTREGSGQTDVSARTRPYVPLAASCSQTLLTGAAAGCPSSRILCGRVGPEYPYFMAINWLEVAKKMAEDARAQLAINRKRLREILAERTREQATQESHTNASDPVPPYES
jgi:hypothetical protein